MSFLQCITVNSKAFLGKFEVNYRKIALKIAKIRFLCLYINIHEEKGLKRVKGSSIIIGSDK